MRARPKPLAMYIFAMNKREQRQILDNTTAGGVCVNGVLYQVGQAPTFAVSQGTSNGGQRVSNLGP